MCHILTLCILKTPKWVLWHTMKTQMKCSIILHFIRVSLFDKIKKKPLETEMHHNLGAVPYLLYQYVWENPSEYKGLTVRQFMRLRYLTYLRGAKVQASLRQCPVSHEPSLRVHTK